MIFLKIYEKRFYKYDIFFEKSLNLRAIDSVVEKISAHQ